MVQIQFLKAFNFLPLTVYPGQHSQESRGYNTEQQANKSKSKREIYGSTQELSL